MDNRNIIMVLIGVVILTTPMFGFSQDQIKADSLKELISEEVDLNLKNDLLFNFLLNEQNRDTVIKYSLLHIDILTELNTKKRVSGAYGELAMAYSQKGMIKEAVENFHKSLETALSPIQTGTAHGNLASAYQGNNDFERAEYHSKKAITIFRQIDDQLRLGTSLVSLGYLYYLEENYAQSIISLKESVKIFSDTSIAYNDYYWSYAAGNLALSEARNMDLEISEKRIDTVIQILEKYQDEYAISDYRVQMAIIYFENGLYEKSLKSALEGVQLAEKNDFRKYKRDGYEVLAKLYQEKHDFESAFDSYTKFTANKDSLTNADLTRQLANQRTEFEVGQKQIEVDLLTAEKKTQQVVLLATAGFALILLVLAGIIFKYYRNKNRVNKILAEQRDELERLNGTKDKFFSIISHDLRGPVASFHGVSRLIKYFVESKETDQLIEIADEMDKSVDRLSSLLDNLLNWAMQQQGHFPNVPEKLRLQELADEQIATLTNMANAKKIKLESKIDSPIYLWCDKNTTMTILRNLLNNALKFTPEKGSVTLRGFEVDGMGEIKIIDTGVGIPEEKLKKLFQLQDKKSTYGTSGEKGLGLGLQLVYEFIEMNGGSIQVESQERKGTEFIIRLPLFESVGETVDK
ncbi:MAG: tetratricopeptide repeat-containing sensor histidine kinase [Flavobacteriaceae bacterium]|nr:tetratricopeptide repeat-containing sensor histidine kinase [Flavobacteriaceae bacterium]